MEEAIIISVQPKHCYNIIKGLKTEEIRKTFPRCKLPITVFIYCTLNAKDGYETCYGDLYNPTVMNGKIVAKFTLDKIEEINENYTYDFNSCVVDKRWYETKSLGANDLYKKSCLNRDDFDNYFRNKKTMKKCGYAWHISNLRTFLNPRELGTYHFMKPGFDHYYHNHNDSYLEWANKCSDMMIKKAPQSWCYCEVYE